MEIARQSPRQQTVHVPILHNRRDAFADQPCPHRPDANPAGQTAQQDTVCHATNTQLLLHWRQEGVEYRTQPLRRIGEGRTPSEALWRATGMGQTGRPWEFHLTSEDGTFRDPSAGSYRTPLDAAFLQGGELFSYQPATVVRPARRDYIRDAPPSLRSTNLVLETRRYRVMLPRGYHEHPERRYPVIYFQLWGQ